MVKNAFKLLHVAFFLDLVYFKELMEDFNRDIFKKETVSSKADRSSIKLKIALSK